jgi:hypothetical protein
MEVLMALSAGIALVNAYSSSKFHSLPVSEINAFFHLKRRKLMAI